MTPEDRKDALRQLALSIAGCRGGAKTMRLPQVYALMSQAIEEIRKEMEKDES